MKKLKRVTYQGKIYTVEDSIYGMCKLSGVEYYIREKDCSHWLSGWFYKFFNITFKNEMK